MSCPNPARATRSCRSRNRAGKGAFAPQKLADNFSLSPLRPQQPLAPSKTRHQNPPSETGSRRGASVANFRTRRPAHICRMPPKRAVLSGLSMSGGGDRTGWLGRQDSNHCISESNSLRLSARGGRSRTCASRVKLSCRPLAKESLRRTNTSGSDSEMQRFESAPTSQSVSNAYWIGSRGRLRLDPANGWAG